MTVPAILDRVADRARHAEMAARRNDVEEISEIDRRLWQFEREQSEINARQDERLRLGERPTFERRND